MVFTDDTAIMLQAAVVLANSGVGTDTMTTVETLDGWYAGHLHTEHRASGPEELESVRAVRHLLYDLLSSDRDTAATRVNDLLAESGAIPQLVRHGAWDWHLHGVSAD